MENIHNKIIGKIDELKDEMIDVSKKIHGFSELAFNEKMSSSLLEDVMDKYGFKTKRGVGTLDTAFKAVYKGKKDHPCVAFLAEYDALPGIGHGCGHNLIGPASAFAAIALSKVLADDLDGCIMVIGTPAEEIGGGKIILLDEGAFDDVDYSLMSHPAELNQIGRGGRAITSIHLEFFGKSAHSSAPENGINALKAVICTFTGIDSIAETFPYGANTNGIIQNGGEADNIIPDYAKCQFSVRANTRNDLIYALEKIKNVIKSIELLTGAKSKLEIEPIYAERHPNMTMEYKYKEYMESLGEKVNIANPVGKYGSSDIGNISLKMPTIHTYFRIMDKPVNEHSRDFTDISITDSAFSGMVKTSKALSMIGADLLLNKEFRDKADSEYVREVKQKIKE